MNSTESPLVSIILCFYNEEKFIDESIQSVIQQDYQNWELILVDDGSSDKSTSIAKKYSQEFPQKIFYLHHPGHCNEGLSASRNFGIEKSKGDFIAFIDADDVWLGNKLSEQLKIFQIRPEATVLLESSLYWYSWYDKSRADVKINVGVHEGLYQPPLLMMQLYPLGKGAAPCPCGIMIRRSVFERCWFEESFKGIYQMYEDQAFLCKVYLKETVYVSNACHNKYRQRNSSLVSSVYESGKYHNVRSYYLQWLSGYLTSQRPVDKRVKALVKKARMPYKEPLRYKMTVNVPRIAKAILAKVLVKLGVLKYHKI